MCSLAFRSHPQPASKENATRTATGKAMAAEGGDRAAQNLSPHPQTAMNGAGSRPNSRPSSPQRFPVLPTEDDLGAALQTTVEGMSNNDVDTSAMVYLANCPGASRKMEDLLPIHYYSWKLKSVEAALTYTLLHMFVLQAQYKEMAGERATYEEYVAQLKSKIAQLEEEVLEEEGRGGRGEAGLRRNDREELLRLRRENAELRQKNEKLQSSQAELFQINDAWARDYESLSKRIDALTSGNWTNGSTISTAQLTPAHPPSFTHNTHVPCATCHDFEQQLNSLQRQMTEKAVKCEKLGKTLEKMEIEMKRKDLMIERLDSENQAVQLQIQEIGDLQKAVTLKENYRKLELQMEQKQRQYQDTMSQKLQLQQQVDKLKHAFMSIFGIVSSSAASFAQRQAIYHHDCRAHQYMSEPLPPPPTPPGLIARGDHFGSLVEKDKRRVLYDEQVTGFERATPNLSLPDPHSWPKVTQRSPRPNTLLPQTNGVQSKHLICPTCTKQFRCDNKAGFDSWFDHISYCGPKR